MAYGGRYEMDKKETQNLLKRWEAEFDKCKTLAEQEPEVEVMNLDAKTVIKTPRAVIAKLAAFADFEPMEEVELESAIKWVDPNLYHDYIGTNADAKTEQGTDIIEESEKE